jgi:hypothetical protein
MRVPVPVKIRALCLAASVAVAVPTVPRLICGRDAGRWFDGDRATQDALARGVARAVVDHRGTVFFHTGEARFDGQSAIAIYQMAILGLGQVVLEHPERRAEYLPAIRAAADRLVDPETLRYAARVYGHNGLVRMGPGEGHAYLGYVNLALGMVRLVDPETPHARLHDRLTAQLAARLDASPRGLVETYPGETWPPDVAAVAGSIGLHGRAAGADHRELLDRWAQRFAACALDRSGYLVQAVRSGSCAPLDAPRGSGTAVASYFVSFAHRGLSRRLHGAVAREGRRSLLGFAGVREYARGHAGAGDVNAGPILLGISVGATGFALGAARANGDRRLFVELYRTTHLFGLPVDHGGRRTFAAGGVLGDALLLAMLTARPP